MPANVCLFKRNRVDVVGVAKDDVPAMIIFYQAPSEP